ncbi:MAG: ABC transporter ATP-binding protein [Lachnospiraceae bacterium]|nr:ABC transporter ATP-binding protein [Lachnospiraceae bacterium]
MKVTNENKGEVVQLLKHDAKTNNPGNYTKLSLVWEFLKGSKTYFAISIIATLMVNALDMVTPQVIRTTVDSIIGNEPLDVPAFVAELVDRAGGVGYLKTHLWVIGIVIALIALASAVCRYLNTLYNSKGSERFVKTMRNRLFSHIQRLPFSWHMKNQTGDIIQRCTSDVDMIKNFVSEQLTAVFRIVMMIVLSLSFMFAMNPKLTLVAACFVPVVVGYSTIFHSKIRDRFTECDENEGVLSTIAQENLTGIRVVRAFGREKFEKDRFEKQNNIYTDEWMKLCTVLSLFWGAGDLVSGLQIMLIVVLGSYFCVRGEMTAGEFIAFVSYNTMLIWPVRSLGRTISEMSKASVSVERIRYIMNSEAEQDKPDAVTPDLNGDIEFKHVTFGYGDIPVLSDVSFTIPKGTTFGILGGTGSGKSTLMHLLNRLYDLPAENGQITISGVDIADMKGEWVREHIGMVLQEPFLFSRTIAENIGITKEHMSLGEIREAAAIACVDHSVMEFTRGYDTVVGERGVTLSGGQKQRTAIARMLVQKTPIMVFDDSLSAVDAQTDAMIRQALKEKLAEATVILIAHRVTTLMQADCIMVLDKGRIAEIGSHRELMEKHGIYRKIYDMQMTVEEEVEADE